MLWVTRMRKPVPDGKRRVPLEKSDLGNRREAMGALGERGQMGARSRRIAGLFNDNARTYGPLSPRRSRFTLSPIAPSPR